MTDSRHLCQCGKPIHDGANLCAHCVGAMRRDLRTIAERWEDLEAALTAPGAAPLHLVPPERGDLDNTGNPVGIDLNEMVVKARTLTSELAWFMVQVVRDDYDDLGRSFRAPVDQSVPSLLLWLERWHLSHIVGKDGNPETAQEIADDIHKAEKATFNALNAVRIVHVGIPCVEHGTSDMGERVPCSGHMTARATGEVVPPLVCSEDRSHKIAPDSWQRDGWRKRFARPLDHAGMAALAAKIMS